MVPEALSLLKTYLQSPDLQNKPFCTLFLEEAALTEARFLEASHKNFSFYRMGGYRGAKRQRILVMPNSLDEEPKIDRWISLLELPEESSHSFNRALMEEKIDRGMLGDILAGGPFFQVLVATEHLEELRKKLGGQPGEVRLLSLGEVLSAGSRQTIVTSESSLRLDAVSSAGFRISRSQMTSQIKKGGVKLNFQEIRIPHKEVKAGDMISLMFKGRIKILSIQNTTKNRYRVEIDIYR